MNRVAFDFTDTAVLVTGGTSGIGHAIATTFADAGARVTVTGTPSRPRATTTPTSTGSPTTRWRSPTRRRSTRWSRRSTDSTCS